MDMAASPFIHDFEMKQGLKMRPGGKGTYSTWQPCDHFPIIQVLGQRLCVPPFRAVCLFQVKYFKKAVTLIFFNDAWHQKEAYRMPFVKIGFFSHFIDDIG
jgi:hypothetical protein